MNNLKKIHTVQFRVDDRINDIIIAGMLLERRDRTDYCRLKFCDAMEMDVKKV